MKYNISFKKNVMLTAFIAVMGMFTACDDSIDVTSVDENQYTTSTDAIGYIVNNEGKRGNSSIEFRTEGSADLFLGLSKNVEKDVTAKLVYQADALKAYNETNNTDYELFPQELVTLEQAFSVKKGSKKSEKVEVKFKTGATLVANKTYVIPLQSESADVKLSTTDSNYFIFIKDLTNVPDCNKATGMKIIHCMSANNTNPLNNLNFILKDSKKQLFDWVILFSSNINYNAETGRVYIYHNPNCEHILSNRDKYIKPLQDRGIKVLLSVLGNHDRSGINNLSDETAREFAQEIKMTCDAYGLDGVFFDDEYSSYINPAPVGFVSPSSAAAARLCYETKQAMPDRLVTTYVWADLSSLPSVQDDEGNEVEPGNFVDCAIHDYGRGSDLSSSYPGLDKENMGLYSQEFAQARYAYESNLVEMRDNGYKKHMIFVMDPFADHFWFDNGGKGSQKEALEKMTKTFFGEDLMVVDRDGNEVTEYDKNKFPNQFYKKDW